MSTWPGALNSVCCSLSCCQQTDALIENSLGTLVLINALVATLKHALTGIFTLDMYGHTLEWAANEDPARRPGEEIAKAVAEAEAEQRPNLDSDHLPAHQNKNSQAANLGSH